jgi:hypothetical protein
LRDVGGVQDVSAERGGYLPVIDINPVECLAVWAWKLIACSLLIGF